MASSSLLPRILLGTAIALTAVSGVMNVLHRGAAKAAREEAKIAQSSLVALNDQVKKVSAEAKTAKEELKTVAEAKAAIEAKSAKTPKIMKK